MMGRIGVWLMGVLAYLPLPVLRGMGWFIGRVSFVLIAPRRKVALRNLELCFPEATQAQRTAWAKETFVLFCQTFLDRSWLWGASQKVVESRLHMTGDVQALRGSQPLVIFAPHFYGMDAAGLAVLLYSHRESTSIYASNPNPALDDWIREGRQRFGSVRMFTRHEGVKPVIANLRRGGMLYLLPDLDHGRNHSIFVPFFGVQAATVPSLSRFARMARAQVVSVATKVTPQGYEIHVSSAWQNFPSDDVEADTALMNQQLESYIRPAPAQYYWVHKRFKTRPDGEPSVYGKQR